MQNEWKESGDGGLVEQSRITEGEKREVQWSNLQKIAVHRKRWKALFQPADDERLSKR